MFVKNRNLKDGTGRKKLKAMHYDFNVIVWARNLTKWLFLSRKCLH